MVLLPGELVWLGHLLQVDCGRASIYIAREVVGVQAVLFAVHFLRRRWVEPHGTPESLLQPAGHMLRYLRPACLRHLGMVRLRLEPVIALRCAVAVAMGEPSSCLHGARNGA